jgi:hypothetical protein
MAPITHVVGSPLIAWLVLEPGKTISLYKSIIVAYVIARIACDLVGIACCVIMVLVTRFLKLISCNLTINAKTSAKIIGCDLRLLLRKITYP